MIIVLVILTTIIIIINKVEGADDGKGGGLCNGNDSKYVDSRC